MKYELKSVTDSDDVRRTEHGKIQFVNVGDHKVARFELGKGWKWSSDVKPIAKTEWCEAPHYHYLISGRFHYRFKDGTEFEAKPGDVYSVPPGHDAWVVGEEPAVGIEFTAEGISRELSRSSS